MSYLSLNKERGMKGTIKENREAALSCLDGSIVVADNLVQQVGRLAREMELARDAVESAKGRETLIAAIRQAEPLMQMLSELLSVETLEDV